MKLGEQMGMKTKAKKAENISKTIRLDGKITTSSKFNNSTKKWYCTALEFDLVGIGKTEEEAFKELKVLLRYYLLEFVESTHSGGKMDFFNPSEAENWNTGKKKEYGVTLIVELAEEKERIPEFIPPKKLSKYYNRISGIDLIPVYS
jgi:hypothetical protein